MRVLDAAGSGMRALAYSPDGRQLAAAGRRGPVRIWDAATGRLLRDLEGHTRQVCSLAYSPDGALLASAGHDRTIRVWDTTSGRPVAEMPQQPGHVLALAFCGADTLAAGTSSNVIHVWNLATGRERCRLVGHTGSVTFDEAETDAGVITATNGTGLVFDNADGAYTFNHAVVLSNTVALANAHIGITNGSAGLFTFKDTTITDPTGTAFDLNGGTATVAFTGKITKSNAGAAVTITNEHTGLVTFSESEAGAGVVTATAGTGIALSNADGTYSFNDAVTLSGGAVVDISADSSGTVTFDGDSAITTTAGNAFTVRNSAATVIYSGEINSGTAGRPVEVYGNTGGTVTFGGEITGAANGIYVHDNTGGTFQFNGLVNLDTTTNAAVTLTSNTGATIAFSDLDVNTTSGAGFTATGGGTIQLTGTGNTVATTTTGVGLNLNGVEISGSGAAFESISVNGAANGIVLNNVTGTGTLSIGSGGSSVGDGGTIQNTTGDGILITNAAHVSLNNMLVTGAGGDGLDLADDGGSFNVTIADCDINTAADQGIELIDSNSGSMRLTLNNNQIAQNTQESMVLTVGAGTANNITLNGNSVNNSSGQEAVLVTVNGAGTTANFLAENNSLSNSSASATLSAQANDSSTLNATIHNNTLSNGNGRALEVANDDVAAVQLSMLDNSASSGSVPGKPYLLQKNGGSFGVVLLNPQPDSEGFTAQNVNQRNGGTGTYAEYVTDNATWVIEFLPDAAPPTAPISLGFTSLNVGVVPTP